MKKILYYTLFFCLQFFVVENAHATHIIGGEMSYKCLGNNKYEITLTIFRDCYNGVPQFDDTANVAIFDQNYQLLDSISLLLNPDDTLKAILSDTCLVVPKNVCVHTTTYKDTIELLPRVGGYIIAYQRCCRNITIVNIVNPSKTGATFSVNISEQALTECNTSAKFKNWPPIFICVNEPIKFDHSAFDKDSDSIFYRICTPLKGATDTSPKPTPVDFVLPFEEVVWKNPYGLTNILGGKSLKIDPKTGELSGLPNTIGQFVVGICAEEYRKGKLISINRRDFQYNVGLCGTAGAAIFAPKIQCDDLAVVFENTSQNANTFVWDFGISTTTTDTSNAENPTYIFPSEGNYTVRLIASPNSACADTAFHKITLSKSTLTPDFSFTFGACNDSLAVNFTDKSTDPNGAALSWEWQMYQGNDTIKSALQNPILKPWKAGTWTTKMTAFAKNGCPKTIIKPVLVDLVKWSTPDTVSACIGDLVTLNANPQVGYTYLWSPTTAFTDPSAGQQETLITAKTQNFVVSITSPSCKAVKYIRAKPEDSTPKLTLTATPDTIFFGKTTQLEASVYPSSYKYTWSPIKDLSKIDISNPLASPSETTLYKLTVTPPGGDCAAVAEARVVVLFPDCGEPYIFIPTAFTPNDDGVNDVLFVRGPVKELYFVIYDRWGEKVFETTEPNNGWDGYISTTPLPPDVYGFYIQVTCFDDKKFFKKGNVSLIR